MTTSRIIFTPTPQRVEVLENLHRVTGLSYAELLRRMIDFCTREKRLNKMFPACSGGFGEK